MNSELTAQTYDQLRRHIAEIIASGRQRARRAVEAEKVRTSWEIGRYLHLHLLAQQDRAEYGRQLVPRLAEDLEVGEQRLYEMLKFYRSFPILRTSGELSFSHYVKLLSVHDESLRYLLHEKAERETWSVRQLDLAIKEAVAPVVEPENDDLPPLLPRRGRLQTYRVAAAMGGGLRLDLGFGILREVEGLEELEAGQVVHAVRRHSGYQFSADRRKTYKLYTYGAQVRRVVDGDTLWCDIDCGFGVWTRQKLRLRGVDTPELGSVEGERASRLVQGVLKRGQWVGVATSRADKYDRYLADIYYLGEGDTAVEALERGSWLNGQLLRWNAARRFAG